HYMLAELLGRIGETNRAIVALEHAHSVRPLRDSDVLKLAEMYVAEQAPGQATSHLRQIASDSAEFGRAQELLGIVALQKGDQPGARAHFARAAAGGHSPTRAVTSPGRVAAPPRARIWRGCISRRVRATTRRVSSSRSSRRPMPSATP